MVRHALQSTTSYDHLHCHELHQSQDINDVLHSRQACETISTVMHRINCKTRCTASQTQETISVAMNHINGKASSIAGEHMRQTALPQNATMIKCCTDAAQIEDFGHCLHCHEPHQLYDILYSQQSCETISVS